MNPITVLRIYFALKAHFTSKYDIFQSNAQIPNATDAVLQANKARRNMICRYADMCTSPADVMGHMFPQWLYSYGESFFDYGLADTNYNKWQKFRTAPEKYIMDDLHEANIFQIIMGTEPEILKLVSRGTVKIESAVALNKLVPYINPSIDYFQYKTLGVIINKSAGFIKFDQTIVRNELGLYETT